MKTENKIIFGSFYTTYENDADSSFPKYCQLFETDICLSKGSFQQVLSRLFFMGFKIIATDGAVNIVLAEHDIETKSLKGYGSELTLFYIGKSLPVK